MTSADVLISICIPTYNRINELSSVLEALYKQSFNDFEIILIEGGNYKKTARMISRYRKKLRIKLAPQETKGLVGARNEALTKAKGEFIAFIDDDVQPSSNWLKELVDTFRNHEDVVGVGGPAFIEHESAMNRDLTSFLLAQNSIIKRIVKEIFFRVFTENKPFLINHFFKSGAFSLGSMVKTAVNKCNSIEQVDYLDASNMCFSKEILMTAHGFDPSFSGIGDYSEADLCFRIRKINGKLLFNPRAFVYHYPSRSGIFSKRSVAHRRSKNFMLFHRRHFGPNIRYFLYLFFLRSYYLYKTLSNKNKDWLTGVIGTFGK
jgi:glycosyltransferase involved in cell wall biosynthesis